ncbi:putative uncharacterized protein DDB_G0286901 [Condylostylus longicornis]|uniref:putative uncharacterized protein DDB_G0286901 n=1 Tax=Condylostylus longicornis TaxID=2530218 RepID=UPI00244DCFFB|nr:putative uncharacterized protein DDB_G0286901 [Condylostylus longicornis]XP_055377162.1 putative uncharacterized protein DDB_G0286901 [Condylostylus longicornis]
MPPINLYNTDVVYLKKSIKNDLKIDNFLVKELNDNHAVIYTKSLVDYKNICDMLTKTEANYYTYTPKEEKKITLILKGINKNYNCDDILHCLKTKENESLKFEKVTQLATKRSITQNISLPYYIVQASPNSSINAIKNIKEIDNSIVTWENIRRKPIQQCTRCQRFSHTASNCHMDYRCVKCGESHKIGECKITSEDGRDKLYCTLCKQHGHPSSYKNCTEYKRRMQIKEEMKNRIKQNISQRHMSYNNYVQTGISYSNAVRSNNINNNNYNNYVQTGISYSNAARSNNVNNNNFVSKSYNENTRNINNIDNNNSINKILEELRNMQQNFNKFEKQLSEHSVMIAQIMNWYGILPSH